MVCMMYMEIVFSRSTGPIIDHCQSVEVSLLYFKLQPGIEDTSWYTESKCTKELELPLSGVELGTSCLEVEQPNRKTTASVECQRIIRFTFSLFLHFIKHHLFMTVLSLIINRSPVHDSTRIAASTSIRSEGIELVKKDDTRRCVPCSVKY